MPSFSAIMRAVVHTSACVLTIASRVDAQSCSISSTAPGPVSCAVTTTVMTTIRMPTLVSVSVTPLPRSQVSMHGAWAASIVQAAFEVSANRSYALQIATAPDSASLDPSSHAAALGWSMGGRAAQLNETPIELATFGSQMGDHGPAVVALSRSAAGQLDRADRDPIRLRLTIVAP